MKNLVVKTCVKKSWKILCKEPLLLMGAALLGAFITAITFGILGMVIYTGLAAMVIKLEKGPKPGVKDIFQYMNKVLFLLVLAIIMGVSVMIGIALLVVPGLIIAALWMYAPLAMAFDDMDIVESLKYSAAMVNANGLLEHIVIVLIISVVNMLGAQLAGIGFLVTFPLTSGFVGLMYNALKGSK